MVLVLGFPLLDGPSGPSVGRVAAYMGGAQVLKRMPENHKRVYLAKYLIPLNIPEDMIASDDGVREVRHPPFCPACSTPTTVAVHVLCLVSVH